MRIVNFGSKIRRLRLQARMTQVQFASRIGVTNITVSKWENEHQTPSLNRMAELERVLAASAGVQAPCTGHPSRTWLDRDGVAAVVTGVVMSIESGASMPGFFETPADDESVNGQATPDGTAAAPDARVPHANGVSGQNARDATETHFGEPGESGRNGTAPTAEGPLPAGVGELVDFDPHDPDEYPASSGIYVLYDISERPLYVGQGKAIDRRLRDHTDKFWFRSPIVETGSYVQIDDKVLRERVEAVLIKFLKSNAVINKRFVDR